MLRSVIFTLALTAGAVSSATTLSAEVFHMTQATLSDAATRGAGFKVGDQDSYSLDVGGIIKGSMVMTVASVTATDLVINQDMDLGFAGKQACVMTLNATNGQAKSMVCNGQAQQLPADSGQTVEQEKQENLTVPAGTFDTLYIKFKNNSDGSEAEIWAATKQVPIGGMVQSHQTSQMGPVVLELTAYKNGN